MYDKVLFGARLAITFWATEEVEIVDGLNINPWIVVLILQH